MTSHLPKCGKDRADLVRSDRSCKRIHRQYDRPILRPAGSVAGLFLIGYGVFRFLVEYVRDFDPTVNTAADLITRGQLLSLPMIIGGIVIMLWAYKRKTA